MKAKKVAFLTLGCKTNQYETNGMIQKFREAGYEICKLEDKPDIYVVNTCTVTNISDRKSRQALRKAKQQNKDVIVVAVGCYAQVAKSDLEKMEEINIILGNKEKKDIVKYVEEYLDNSEELTCLGDSITDEKSLTKKEPTPFCKMTKKEPTPFCKMTKKEPTPFCWEQKKNRPQIDDKKRTDPFLNRPQIDVADISKQKEFDEYGAVTFTDKSRTTIKIQDGCNQFCTYCLIPYARGRVRSRKKENILNEAKSIAQEGIKEIVLTGIHIASYGKDLEEEYKLIDLLEDLNKIEGIKRIRLGSLEPTIITQEFVERLKELEKVCKHFHLSLQSGCDETLKRMNRKYTTAQFKNAVELLRANFEDVNLTTDIIVGFPGETDEEFQKTYNFLKDIAFYKMHVFKYSKRKGTLAASMPNQVDGNVKEERSRLLIELSDKNQYMYNCGYIGKKLEVLFEEKVIEDRTKENEESKDVAKDENKVGIKTEYWVGHSDNYMVVKVNAEQNLDREDNLENKIIKVKILKVDGEELIG